MSFWKYIFWSWSVNKLTQFIIIILLTYFNLAEDEITTGAVDTLEETHGKIIHASVVSISLIETFFLILNNNKNI